MKLFLFLFFLFSMVSAGIYDDWETITDMNEVQDIVFDEDYAWVATTGGIYSYDLSDSQITRFTNLDGLSSIDLRVLEIDNHGYLIAGGENGILEIYSKDLDQWYQLMELEDNTISDILYINDTLWVAAGKGLAVFLWNGAEYKFKDFFRNFDILPNSVSKVALYVNKVWLGTDKGLLSAPSDINKYTINDPAMWNVYTTENGLTHNNILALEVINDKLWIGTSEGLVTINSYSYRRPIG